MPLSNIASQIESVLFMSSSEVSEQELKNLLNISGRELRNSIKELSLNLESENHGIILKSIAGGFILETRPENSEILSRLNELNESEKKRKINLSRAAIETAAIIAYNQPVTRSEIDEIRGVRSDGIVSRLLENGLIKISGRKKTNGSPLLFSTTKKFLEIFGLDSMSDLPALDEIENP